MEIGFIEVSSTKSCFIEVFSFASVPANQSAKRFPTLRAHHKHQEVLIRLRNFMAYVSVTLKIGGTFSKFFAHFRNAITLD